MLAEFPTCQMALYPMGNFMLAVNQKANQGSLQSTSNTPILNSWSNFRLLALDNSHKKKMKNENPKKNHQKS